MSNLKIKKMGTIQITKEKAEFIKRTCTKETENPKIWNSRTYFLPVFFALTDVVVNVNGVTGRHQQDGGWVEYDVEFDDDAQEILQIVK